MNARTAAITRNHPTGRFGRLLIAATAATVTAVMGVGSMGAANALPGGVDTGIGTGTQGGITGSVVLSGCDTQAANVRVTVDNLPVAVSRTGSGLYTYDAPSVAAGLHTVAASMLNGACRLGSWTTQSGSVRVRERILEFGPTLTYRMPRKVTRVPSALIVGAARLQVGAIDVRLNNFGPARRGTRQLDNDSSVTIGGTTSTFTVPEYVFDLDPCGICPDFGDAKFYVKDMRSMSTTYGWTPGKGIDVGIRFESSDREVKGFYLAGAVFTDDVVPDVQIDDGKLSTTLMPVLDGMGGITLAPSGTRFTGTMASTGACSVFGLDVCQAFTGYRSRIRTAAASAADAALGGATVRSQISTRLRSVLTDAGIGVVTGLAVDGDDLLIAE